MDCNCRMGNAGGLQRKSERAKSVRQIFYFAFFATIFSSISCFAQTTRSVALAWDPNPLGEMVIGYRLYYGEQSGKYTSVTNLPLVLQGTVPELTIGKRYYFALTARNQAGIESEFSDELSFEVLPLSTPPIIYTSGDQVM